VVDILRVIVIWLFSQLSLRIVVVNVTVRGGQGHIRQDYSLVILKAESTDGLVFKA